MENIGEFDVDSPDKSHAWCLRVSRYNLSDFVRSIQQMLWEFRAIFLQLTTFPTKSYAQTQFYGTFVSMCNWFKNKSSNHLFAMDL